MAAKYISYKTAAHPQREAVNVEREGQNLKSLRHPSIIPILDFDHDTVAENAKITMEWAETSLAQESGDLVDMFDLIHQQGLERLDYPCTNFFANFQCQAKKKPRPQELPPSKHCYPSLLYGMYFFICQLLSRDVIMALD